MPSVGALILIYFLAIFAFANFEATLALYTDKVLGIKSDEQGNRDNFLVFAYVGAVLMVAGGAYRPLAKRGSEINLLMLGITCMIFGLGTLAIES